MSKSGAAGFDGLDEIDFAVGSVTGVRVWKMDTANCVLEGQHGFRWADGENSAECRHGCPNMPGEECGCGFWAYWDLDAALVFKPAEWAVAGIVEGYGRTMIGDRGFRCARARIVALCLMFDIYTRPKAATDGFYDVFDQQRHPDELALKAEIEHALSLAYPSVQIRTSAKTMLAIHPTTKDYLPEAGGLIDDAEDAGLEIVKPGAVDVAQAFAQFYTGVSDRSIVHLGQPELRSALAGRARGRDEVRAWLDTLPGATPRQRDQLRNWPGRVINIR